MTGINRTLESGCREIGQLTDRGPGDTVSIDTGIGGLGRRLESIATLDIDRLGGRLGQRIVHKHGLSDLVVRVLSQGRVEPVAGGKDDESGFYEVTYPPIGERRTDPPSSADTVPVQQSPLAESTAPTTTDRVATASPDEPLASQQGASSPDIHATQQTIRQRPSSVAGRSRRSIRSDAASPIHPENSDMLIGRHGSPTSGDPSHAPGAAATSSSLPDQTLREAVGRHDDGGGRSPSVTSARQQFGRIVQRASGDRTVLIDGTDTPNGVSAAVQPTAAGQTTAWAPGRRIGSGRRASDADTASGSARTDIARSRLPTVRTSSSIVDDAGSTTGGVEQSELAGDERSPTDRLRTASDAPRASTRSAAAPATEATAPTSPPIDAATDGVDTGTRSDLAVPASGTTAPTGQRLPTSTSTQRQTASDHSRRVASLTARSPVTQRFTQPTGARAPTDRSRPETDSPTPSSPQRDATGVTAMDGASNTTVSRAVRNPQSGGSRSPGLSWSSARGAGTTTETKTQVRTSDDTPTEVAGMADASPLHQSLGTATERLLTAGAGEAAERSNATATAAGRLPADTSTRLDRSLRATETGPSSTTRRDRISREAVSDESMEVSAPRKSDVSPNSPLDVTHSTSVRPPGSDGDPIAAVAGTSIEGATDPDATPRAVTDDLKSRQWRPAAPSGSVRTVGGDESPVGPIATPTQSRPAGIHVPPTALVSASSPSSLAAGQTVQRERPQTPTTMSRRHDGELAQSTGGETTDSDMSPVAGPESSPGMTTGKHSRGQPPGEYNTPESSLDGADWDIVEDVSALTITSGAQPTTPEGSAEPPRPEAHGTSVPVADHRPSTGDHPLADAGERASKSSVTSDLDRSRAGPRTSTEPDVQSLPASPKHRTVSDHGPTTVATASVRRLVGTGQETAVVQRLPTSTRRRVTRQRLSSDSSRGRQLAAPRRMPRATGAMPGDGSNSLRSVDSVALQQVAGAPTGHTPHPQEQAVGGPDMVPNTMRRERTDTDPGAETVDPGPRDVVSGPRRRYRATATAASEPKALTPGDIQGVSGTDAGGWAHSTETPRRRFSPAGHRAPDSQRHSPITDAGSGSTGSLLDGTAGPTTESAVISAISPGVVERTSPDRSMFGSPHGGEVEGTTGDSSLAAGSLLRTAPTSKSGSATAVISSAASADPTPERGQDSPSPPMRTPVDGLTASAATPDTTTPTDPDAAAPGHPDDPTLDTTGTRPRRQHPSQREQDVHREERTVEPAAVERTRDASKTDDSPGRSSSRWESSTLATAVLQRHRPPTGTSPSVLISATVAGQSTNPEHGRGDASSVGVSRRSRPDTGVPLRIEEGTDAAVRGSSVGSMAESSPRARTAVESASLPGTAVESDQSEMTAAEAASIAGTAAGTQVTNTRALERGQRTATGEGPSAHPATAVGSGQRAADGLASRWRLGSQQSATSANQPSRTTTTTASDRRSTSPRVDNGARGLPSTTSDDRTRSDTATTDESGGGPRAGGAAGRNRLDRARDGSVTPSVDARTDVRQMPQAEFAEAEDGDNTADTPSQPQDRERTTDSKPGGEAAIGRLATAARSRPSTLTTEPQSHLSAGVGALSTGRKSSDESIKYKRQVSEYNASNDRTRTSRTERTTTTNPQADTSLVYRQEQSQPAGRTRPSDESGGASETPAQGELPQSYEAQFPSERGSGAGRAGPGKDNGSSPGSRNRTGRNGYGQQPTGDVFGGSPFDSGEQGTGDVGSKLSNRATDNSAGRESNTTDRARSRLSDLDVQLGEQSMQLNADVDRLVDILYRKLERKRRMERKRRGF